LNVFKAIDGRRSIRYYAKKELAEEDLEKILEAAMSGPSAGDVHPWELIVVRDKERRIKLARVALDQAFISIAPAVIVVCLDLEKSAWAYGVRGRTLYCIQDAAAATQNMLLAAYALGLGTCWVGAFDEEAVRKILSIPEQFRPVSIITVGHPSYKPAKRERRHLSEVVHNETFQK